MLRTVNRHQINVKRKSYTAHDLCLSSHHRSTLSGSIGDDFESCGGSGLLRSAGDEPRIVSRANEFPRSLPDLSGHVLVDLESARGIDANPLEIPDHDADHLILRQ